MSTMASVSGSQAIGGGVYASCYHHRSSIVQEEPVMSGTLPLDSSVTGVFVLVVSAREHTGRHIERLTGLYLTFEDTSDMWSHCSSCPQLSPTHCRTQSLLSHLEFESGRRKHPENSGKS